MEATFILDLVEWVEPAFIVAGYYIVAAAVLMERSIFIGLIIPGDLILALGGVYASNGNLELGWIIAIGIAAAIAGESIGYWLGRRYGVGLLRHLPILNRFADKLADAQTFFRRHGGKTVVIGRYATAAGSFVPFSAGVGRMPYPRFLLYDVPSIAVWATAIAYFGYVFGNNLPFIDKVISRVGWIVLGLVVVFFLSRWLWKRRRERNTPDDGEPTPRRDEERRPEPVSGS